jgi:hypothetical protein
MTPQEIEEATRLARSSLLSNYRELARCFST